ncbi:MAG: polysaccharide lyase [Gemmatimonadales bacterium]
MTFRITGANYENHSLGTKFGWVGYGVDPNKTQNQSTFMIMGTGRPGAKLTAMRIQYRQQGHTGEQNWLQNLDRRPVVRVGEWQQLEAVFRLNDIGQSNGTLDVWVNGIQVMHHTTMTFRTRAAPNGFTLWYFNPTYGGGANQVRDRQDEVEIDEVYLSGLPLEG